MGADDLDAVKELLARLGLVCVNATALEFLLVQVVALAEQHDDDWCRRAMSNSGQALKAYQRAARKSLRGFGTRVPGLAERAAHFLDERNKVVHSVAIMEVEELVKAEEISWWHPKSDIERSVSTHYLDQISGGLQRCYLEAAVLIESVRQRRMSDAPSTAED